MRVFGHQGGDQTADLGKRAMTLRVLLCNWDQHRCFLVKDQREGKQRRKGKPFLVKEWLWLKQSSQSTFEVWFDASYEYKHVYIAKECKWR